MKTTRCPACNSDVIIEDEAYEGDLIDCTNCGQELEIVSLHPPQLALNKDNAGYGLANSEDEAKDGLKDGSNDNIENDEELE